MIKILTAKNVGDLGIMICNTATFTLHVRNIVKKARVQVGWAGALCHANTLKSLNVITLLEYCCQFWNLWKVKDIYRST